MKSILSSTALSKPQSCGLLILSNPKPIPDGHWVQGFVGSSRTIVLEANDQGSGNRFAGVTETLARLSRLHPYVDGRRGSATSSPLHRCALPAGRRHSFAIEGQREVVPGDTMARLPWVTGTGGRPRIDIEPISGCFSPYYTQRTNFGRLSNPSPKKSSGNTCENFAALCARPANK